MAEIQGPGKRFVALGPGSIDKSYIVYDNSERKALEGTFPTFEAANEEAARLNQQ
jgi:hypothetical protein